MIPPNLKTPGVYINENAQFATTVTAVPTAIPAFIGYTPQAIFQGVNYTGKPLMINSFAGFRAVFGYPDPDAPAPPAKQYSPQYYLVLQKSKPAGNYVVINGGYYAVLPDPDSVYYLYNSVKLFYQNGGAAAYIVSVGGYGQPSQKPMALGAPLINSNVHLNDLLGGLQALLNRLNVTMYICPDATLLSIADNATLMQAMLSQSSAMQTAISIFDIIGGKNPDPVKYTDDIATFRNSTGITGLDFGAAYYPFVGTTIMQPADMDYTNLFGGDTTQLAPLINPASNPDTAVGAILNDIQSQPSTPETVAQYTAALTNASSTYNDIINNILADANILPPSGGMAGVITTTDTNYGVWESPANKSMVGVVSLPIYLSDSQQEPLNVDPVSGKSINVIRRFESLGILIWGARTLDGNNYDRKYIAIRRTLIMLEQSCKLGIEPFVFEPNNLITWGSIIRTLTGFLTAIWQQGGLLGAEPSAAFSIACGLGRTMTEEDILNGVMRVSVGVSVIMPAEFIVFTLEQQMAASE